MEATQCQTAVDVLHSICCTPLLKKSVCSPVDGMSIHTLCLHCLLKTNEACSALCTLPFFVPAHPQPSTLSSPLPLLTPIQISSCPPSSLCPPTPVPVSMCFVLSPIPIPLFSLSLSICLALSISISHLLSFVRILRVENTLS